MNYNRPIIKGDEKLPTLKLNFFVLERRSTNLKNPVLGLVNQRSSKVFSIEDSVRAVDVKLSDDEVQRIDRETAS